MKDNGTIRISTSGATRDSALNKPEYPLYMHPLVKKARGEYMLKHQIQSDGVKRDGDNWKKRFNEELQKHLKLVYCSYDRHNLDIWMDLEGFESRDGIDEAFGGAFFNLEAMWSSILEERYKRDHGEPYDKEIDKYEREM